MKTNDFREELEIELAWRIEELLMLKKNLFHIDKQNDKEKYRKSLIVMLYSHFEGFIKRSFIVYTEFINELELKQLNLVNKPILIALSMDNIFKKYNDTNQKHNEFKEEEDKKLHAIFRKTEFIKNFKNNMNDIIEIKEYVVDTESNLTQTVMRKLLYKFGISYDTLDVLSPLTIKKLVQIRNHIAHGNKQAGIKEDFYNNLERNTIKVMEDLIRVLHDEARELKILKD